MEHSQPLKTENGTAGKTSKKPGKKPSGLIPFKPGQSGNPGGRPRKSITWKDAENALREALPRLLLMERSELTALLQGKPTGAEMLAAKYLHEYVPQSIERFLGKVKDVVQSEVTGANGEPLIPAATISLAGLNKADLGRFIAAAEARAKMSAQRVNAAKSVEPLAPKPAADAS